MKSVIKMNKVIANTYIIMLSTGWVYMYQWKDAIRLIRDNIAKGEMREWKFSNTIDCMVKQKKIA